MYDGGYFLSGTAGLDVDTAAVLAASAEAGFGDMGEYSGASVLFPSSLCSYCNVDCFWCCS